MEIIILLSEKLGINLSLKIDLNPAGFGNLLKQLNFPNVTVNYDIGNSASLGYSFREEWEVYGTKISDIHSKDRTLGGGSMKLGTGNANLPNFFYLLSTYSYDGPFIMQAYRDEEGMDIFL